MKTNRRDFNHITEKSKESRKEFEKSVDVRRIFMLLLLIYAFVMLRFD